uniref:Synaptosomal-associated protein 29 n=1 Tax=Magallana gigas TaxID=29159 RepID=K1QBK7_MAGGI|eukprot:XP_011415111.1 PREDICTED: synaptosomal-associated protein 29 [Crassostrea gigas]
MAVSKNSNPFFAEEDEEDCSFEKKEKIQEQIFASEDRQLDSTMRALRSIQESESMGVATAEELLRQGEQLNNIERKTDEINQTMTVTQKHLNNIKSVFGGIKNWWGAKKTSTATKEPETKPNRLQETLEKHRSDQPVRRNPDTRGFYQEDDDLDEDFMKGARTQQYFKPVTHSAREEQLNENLGEISNGLTTLKGLALGLGDEIERQNNQLDRLGPKVGKANDHLEHQNKQMKTILRK